jgi:hypothetical protein
MGLLKFRFKARRGSRREVFTSTVDSGADITTLNLDTACALGLDLTTARQSFMQAPGQVTLVGYELDEVELAYKRKKAHLKKVFVPIRAEVNGSDGKHVVNAAKDEEQLIGHDFLQAANATLDFQRHALEGRSEFAQLVRPRMVLRPATLAQRALLAKSPLRCPVPSRRRR